MDVESEEIRQMENLKKACQGCKERMEALGLKGKKRDDATIHYMVGCAQFVPELAAWISMILVIHGYSAVEKELQHNAPLANL